MTENNREEKINYLLERLYRSCGYTCYRMSNFEEYDLYAKNRNFLASSRILSFTDVDGRLMAFKPDVTLSIIKNTKDDGRTKKIYYTEHVVRVPRNGDGFKEIPQTGLECLGEMDMYQTAEVITLALKSLDAIKEKGILVISDLDILDGVMSGLDEGLREDLMDKIAAKNIHGIREADIDDGLAETICGLAGIYGPLDEAVAELERLDLPAESGKGISDLKELAEILGLMGVRERIAVDFSIVDDLAYYNSIIFKGYLDGAYQRVLSGGRYDNMMRKMGRRDGAIGFAIYMDALESLEKAEKEDDCDVLILYDDSSDMEKVVSTAARLLSNGSRVRVQRDEGAACRRTVRIEGSEVKEIGR